MKHIPNGPNVTGISTDLTCSCIKCDVLRLKYFGVSGRDIEDHSLKRSVIL